MTGFFVDLYRNSFSSSECLTFSVSIYVTFQIVFWSYNLFLILIELNDIPSIEKYRIQKNKEKLRFQKDLVRQMIRGTIEHQIALIVFLPLLFVILNSHGKILIDQPIPSLGTILYHLFIYIIIEDFLFFWTHYLFHTPYLYKKIHKKHHYYKQPTGVVFILSDPIESLVQNQIPVWFGPWLFQEKHLFTLCLWVFIRVYQTMNAHSGYDLPYISPQYYFPWLLSGTLEHDYHHQHTHANYGSFFTLWDRIMKTHRLQTIR